MAWSKNNKNIRFKAAISQACIMNTAYLELLKTQWLTCKLLQPQRDLVRMALTSTVPEVWVSRTEVSWLPQRRLPQAGR